MEMKEYLQASERTEKKFPDGMKIDGNNAFVLNAITSDLTTVSEALDHMKRHLIYGADLELRAPQTEFSLPSQTLDSQEAEMFHAAMGMVTEAVEFFEAVATSVLKGKDMDGTNLFEEIGDQMWYQALALRLLEQSFENTAAINIAKLAKRFPDKFTSEDALNRDLDTEREVLESGHGNDGAAVTDTLVS